MHSRQHGCDQKGEIDGVRTGHYAGSPHHDDDKVKLAEMRRLGASEERITHFVEEIQAWERRLQNLEAAAR